MAKKVQEEWKREEKVTIHRERDIMMVTGSYRLGISDNDQDRRDGRYEFLIDNGCGRVWG